MKIGNWPALLRVIEHIITNPEQHHQRGYLRKDGARCIAGWLAFFAGYTPVDGYFGITLRHPATDEHHHDVEDAAFDALDVDPQDRYVTTRIREALFLSDLTMDEILESVHDMAMADGIALTPVIAAELVRRGISGQRMED